MSVSLPSPTLLFRRRERHFTYSLCSFIHHISLYISLTLYPSFRLQPTSTTRYSPPPFALGLALPRRPLCIDYQPPPFDRLFDINLIILAFLFRLAFIVFTLNKTRTSYPFTPFTLLYSLYPFASLLLISSTTPHIPSINSSLDIASLHTVSH